MPPQRKLPPYVTSYTDGRGKTRYRAQKAGRKNVELGTVLWGPIFRERYAAFLDAEPKPAEARYPAGTFGALITAYQSSHEFAKYAPATKLMYRRAFQRILDVVADLPCGDRWFQTHHAQNLIDKINGPAARDSFRKKLGVLMRFAMRTGVRSTDPVDATRSGFEASDGIAPWSREQVQAALSAYSMDTPTGLALNLLFETAAALVDGVRFGPQHVVDGCIVYKRQKLGVKEAVMAVCPLSPELLAHLATITTPTFLTHKGKPRSASGLGNRIADVADALGFDGSAHGIRKARAITLYEDGVQLEGIAAILGHSNTAQTAHYIKNASRVRAAKAAIATSNLNQRSHLTKTKNDE